MSMISRGSTAELHVIASLVAGLAARALGLPVLADLAIDRIAGIGLAVGALGIGLFLDHQLGAVPARLGRRLAGRAVLLHEGDLALALVVQRVVGPQVALAGRRGKPGARAPVALQEGEVRLLLGLGRHDHRLGLFLGGRVLFLLALLISRVLHVALVDVLVIRTFALVLTHVLAGRILARILVGHGGVGTGHRRVGSRAAFDGRVAGVRTAHDHAAWHDDGRRAIVAATPRFVGQAGKLETQVLVVLL